MSLDESTPTAPEIVACKGCGKAPVRDRTTKQLNRWPYHGFCTLDCAMWFAVHADEVLQGTSALTRIRMATNTVRNAKRGAR